MVTDQILAQYRDLKRKQKNRDDIIESIEAECGKRIKDVIAAHGEGLNDEIRELRAEILAAHPTNYGVPLEAAYPGFGKVEVRWLPKVEIKEPEELVSWLDKQDREYLYKREITFRKSEINKIVNGLNEAGFPLPDGVKRTSEATLYITLEDG